MRKIIYTGVHTTTSFEQAQENLEVLAEVKISDSQIQRLTVRIGGEFLVEDIQSTDLLEEVKEGTGEPIEVASISIDGGRVQTREENSGTGVHNARWVETKVSCMQILESEENTEDPHPCVPRIFLDGNSVKRMVEGLKRKEKRQKEENEQENEMIDTDLARSYISKTNSKDTYGPKVVNRFAIATIDTSEDFGILVYNKANHKRLHTAKRKAFLGDGDRKIWTMYEDNFKPDGWIPILDFIHAVEYVWDVAKISTNGERNCWKIYIELIVQVWQGKVLTLLRRLDKMIEGLNREKKTKYIREKIEQLSSIRGYFRNNYKKMNYKEYRKKGLPISSCHVESLIKQFNIRIKSTEKFWNESSLNGVLKLKASLLSDDNSWQNFWDNRYQQQVGSKRNYSRAVA